MELDVQIEDDDYSTFVGITFSLEEEQLIAAKIGQWLQSKKRSPRFFGFELMLNLSLENPFSLASKEFVIVKPYKRGEPLRFIISFYPKKYNTRAKRMGRARSLISEHATKCLDELRRLK